MIRARLPLSLLGLDEAGWHAPWRALGVDRIRLLDLLEDMVADRRVDLLLVEFEPILASACSDTPTSCKVPPSVCGEPAPRHGRGGP